VVAAGSAVRAFVQTRGTGRATDYAFLGGAPPEPWWREYRDVTAFDHPTVLITSDGRSWAAYLSGIPSARVDAVGTVVRWTLALDGPCGDPAAGCVGAAVAAWLDDVAGGRDASGQLPAALDVQLPAADVQRWLGRGNGAASIAAAEVGDRVLAALASLPVPAAGADEPGSWVGAVGSVAARRAFTARAMALVAGRPGRALLLNLLGGTDDAAALLDPNPLAVLVEAGVPRTRLVGPKKAPPPHGPRAPAAGPATEPRPVATAPIVLGAAILVLALLVTALLVLMI
jgi:hypothetical protein